MIRSYEDWTFDKVHSFNYPNEFRVQDLRFSDDKTIALLYQISPCKVREIEKSHMCTYRTRCRLQTQESSSNLDDDLSSSNYLVSSDEEEEEQS